MTGDRPVDSSGPGTGPSGADASGADASGADAFEFDGTGEMQLAWAGLLRSFEPPDGAVAGFVAKVGAAAAWAAVKKRRAPTRVLAATEARTRDRSAGELEQQAADDLAAAAAVGGWVMGPSDPQWPTAALVAFEVATAEGVSGSAPPVALYVRGSLPPTLPVGAVAVVGSRACTAYGQRVAADIAMGLADAGVVVLSGAAFGIDTVAHRAALAHPGLSTIAVLACGIDRSYPTANRGLLDRIADVGAVISEYPPGGTPARHRFLVRNRLIAGLTAGTVVVEAGRRSGTLSTAAAAHHLRRVVMAVPGPVTSAMSVGCHYLLTSSEPALLVTSADDVLEAVGGPTRPLAGRPPDTGTEDASVASGVMPMSSATPVEGLSAEVAIVYEALPARAFRSVSQLSVESGLPGRQVMAGLAVLELEGLAGKQSGQWRRLAR